METINTPYDDAFRTLLQDCPELVIPLINELFGTDYTGQEVVLSSTNEIFIRNPNGKKEKRITDSNIEILPSGMPEHAGRNDGNSDVGV